MDWWHVVLIFVSALVLMGTIQKATIRYCRARGHEALDRLHDAIMSEARDRLGYEDETLELRASIALSKEHRRLDHAINAEDHFGGR